MNRSMAMACCSFCLLSAALPVARAIESASQKSAQKQAELPLVFDEDLSSSPFNRFKPLQRGESDWKQGTHWILKSPTAVAFPMKGGRDAELTVWMSFPRLAEGETSETRLGLIYASGQAGIVSFSRKREGEKTVGQILVFRQPSVAGPIAAILRKLELKEDLPGGQWKLKLRAGALAITCNDKEIGWATFETHTQSMIGMAIAQPSGSVTVNRITLRVSSAPSEPSAQQREQAVAAAALNDEARRLLQAKKFAEAIAISHKVIEMYRKLHGDEHPDVANALLNLAVVLKSNGQMAEAVPYFEQALAVRKGLFGADHPDAAQLEMELAGLLVQLMKLEEALPHCTAAHFSFAQYYGHENRSTILTRQMLEKLPPPTREDKT